MKSKSILKITTAVLVFFFVQNSFAQVARVDTLNEVVIKSTSMVNQAVNKAFKKDFKNPINPRWYKMDQNYLVMFFAKEQKNNVLYKKDGALVYHITYLNGNGLPKDVESIVNSKYPDYSILTTFRIEQDARVIWVVNLKVANDFVLARVEDDQLEEVQRFADISK